MRSLDLAATAPLQSKPSEHAPRRFRFAEFELRTSPGVLMKSGSPVALQPQPARALSLLVSRAGEVVTRDQLREHLWGKDRHLDVEQGINFTIRRIRSALDDDSNNPRFVETVPKIGYRFIAPVDRMSEVPARRRLPRAAMAVTAVLLAILAAGIVSRRSGREAPRPDAKLAVLPFTAASVETLESTLPAVLTEELTTDLAGRLAPRLGVIALRSAQTAAEDDGVEVIGARLGADYLLRGNVGRIDDRLRITLRLWRVDDRVHLWARAFEPAVAELPDWSAAVAREIAAALSIDDREPPPHEPRAPIPPAVYETYLQGRYLIGRDDADSIARGLGLLGDAVALAPELARAHAALADGTLKLRTLRPSDEAAGGLSGLAAAEAAARRAIELEPGLTQGHVVLAEILFFYRLDGSGAERELRQALALSPRSVRALHTQGLYLASLGRYDEAISVIRRAVDLDPATVYVSSDLAQVYFWARRFEEAAARARDNLEIDPGNHASRACLIEALFESGDRAGALRQSNLLLEAIGWPRAASRDEANDATLKHLLALEARGGRSLDLHLAALRWSRGDEGRALERLELACRERRDWTLPFLAVDPRFDGLRDHPRYRALSDCLAPLGEPS